MKKTVKLVSIVLMIISILLSLSACGGIEDDIIGMWYDDDGNVLSVQKDGTYNFNGEYGSGTWKILDDDETIEFTDFYGMTKNIEITEDDLGQYIFYHQEKLYKDAYPSEEEISRQEEEISKEREKNATELDAFDGISYEVSGISPYCKVTINVQNCDELVKRYVTFKLDKETYANGENAIVTATLSKNTGDTAYKLKSNESQYMISGQAEYIYSEQQIDKELFEKEVNDVITASISSSVGTNILCDVSDRDFLDYESRLPNANFYARNGIKKVTSTYKATYLSCIKEQKKSMVNAYVPYNRLSYIYCLDVQGDVNGVMCEGKLYVNITAENIVKLPDGSILWNNEKCDFKIDTGVDGFDNCVANTVMSNSDNYNISKVEF